MAAPIVGMAAKAADAATRRTCSARERWAFKLKLYVPRIYDNMSSRGYRKYQWQSLRGEFEVVPSPDSEPDIRFCWMENETHKVNGARVTYDTELTDTPLWHGCGSNKTGKFTMRSAVVQIEAMPSYAIGPAPNEDNSLVLVLSGRGNTTGSQIRGNAAGQLGCGCHEYGHVSPTRIWGTNRAVDTAAVFGTWLARRVA